MSIVKILAAIGILAASATAEAATNPGLEAVKDFLNPVPQPVPVIQNRFFLKEDRFEIAPVFGYVPNNPMVRRFGGGVQLAYHFTETLAAEGTVGYMPDLGENDLKPLVKTLVIIAHNGAGDAEFAQPLDKVTLSSAFGVRFSPIYGKINLVGETVLSFDVYGTAGLGMVSKANYHARYDDESDDPQDPIRLDEEGSKVKLTPVVGAGTNFFLTQSIALKLDLRMALYVDKVPDYDPDTQEPADNKQRLYNNLTANVGFGFYFPKMAPRLYNF